MSFEENGCGGTNVCETTPPVTLLNTRETRSSPALAWNAAAKIRADSMTLQAIDAFPVTESIILQNYAAHTAAHHRSIRLAMWPPEAPEHLLEIHLKHFGAAQDRGKLAFYSRNPGALPPSQVIVRAVALARQAGLSCVSIGCTVASDLASALLQSGESPSKTEVQMTVLCEGRDYTQDIRESLARWKSGLHIDFWEGTAPETLRDQIVTAKSWLYSTLEHDSQEANQRLEGQWLRAEEDMRERAGQRWWTCALVCRESGRILALSDACLDPTRPGNLWQEDTVVTPDLRRRGLGLLVKEVLLTHLGMLGLGPRLLSWNNLRNSAILALNSRLGGERVSERLRFELPTVLKP